MKSSYIISLTIAVLAVLWVGSAIIFPPTQAQDPTPIAERTAGENAPTIDVRVRDSLAANVTDIAVATGRTQANRSVSISSEIEARVDEILIKEGTRVEAGESLAKLAVDDRAARVQQARETLRQREIEFNAATSLEKKGFNSEIRLAEARAAREQARADLTRAEKELGNTDIKAPFAGVISIQYVDEGDFAGKGQELFRIVELDPIEFVAFVTERVVGGLDDGTLAQAVFLDGTRIAGKLSYVAPAANEETRTFRIEVEAPNPTYEIREGLTAELRIPLQQKLTHTVPASVLTLNDQGRLGIKILEDGNIARFMPVRVVRTTGDEIQVAGLPQQITYIAVGAEYAADGSPVNPVYGEQETTEQESVE